VAYAKNFEHSGPGSHKETPIILYQSGLQVIAMSKKHYFEIDSIMLAYLFYLFYFIIIFNIEQ